MSYTELFAAFEDGLFVSVAEFRNSWGSAMFIWEALCGKYRIDGGFFGEDNKYSKLWKGDGDGSLGLLPWEMNALRTTYDNAVVERRAMLAIAASLREFEKQHSDGTKACTLGAQAVAIEEAHRKGARAIGWNQTSVNADCRWSGVRDGDEEEEDCCRPYSIDDDSDHIVYGWALWPADIHTENTP